MPVARNADYLLKFKQRIIMNEMCDFCGGKIRFIYPFDPDGEINACNECSGFYGPQAREIAFKIKNNISENMAEFLEQQYFYVEPKIKAWVKIHLDELMPPRPIEGDGHEKTKS